jgi:hypothetical protein
MGHFCCVILVIRAESLGGNSAHDDLGLMTEGQGIRKTLSNPGFAVNDEYGWVGFCARRLPREFT